MLAPAHAGDSPEFQGYSAVPAKFRGSWITVESDPKGLLPTKIGAKTYDDCSILKIMPADDGGKALTVTWGKCPTPGGGAPNPMSLATTVTWKLTKVLGQEVLVEINNESPVSMSIYRRVK
jgi:hypothetical protein